MLINLGGGDILNNRVLSVWCAGEFQTRFGELSLYFMCFEVCLMSRLEDDLSDMNIFDDMCSGLQLNRIIWLGE